MPLKKLFAGLLACATLTCAAYAASDVPGGDISNNPQERWETLSEQEKNQVYEIMDKRARTELELLEKYAQLGLIEEKKVEEIHRQLEKRLEEMKKSGLFPGAGKGPREEGRKKTL